MNVASKTADREVAFQTFNPSLPFFVDFTHRADGLLDEGVLVFLETDDSSKMVEHGPFIFADDVIIQRSDERRLVRGCITHVVTAELTVVIKRRGDLPCHHGTAFRRIRWCNAQGLGKNAEDLGFIIGYDGVIERHAHRFEVEEQATSGYKAHAPYEGRLVLETSPTTSPSTDLTVYYR